MDNGQRTAFFSSSPGRGLQLTQQVDTTSECPHVGQEGHAVGHTKLKYAGGVGRRQSRGRIRIAAGLPRESKWMLGHPRSW